MKIQDFVRYPREKEIQRKETVSTWIYALCIVFILIAGLVSIIFSEEVPFSTVTQVNAMEGK